MKSLLVLFAFVVAASATSLPENFYGTWDLDRSENFDEYLEAKGYGWFTRKLVTLATFKKEFKKGAGNKFDYANLTSKKNVYYNGVVLGHEFEGEGLDGGKHKVLFSLKGHVVSERHIPIGDGEAKNETYEYEVKDGFLVVTMHEGKVTAKRFYKRV